MGRKKKKELKPWCWYCNREFDEEKVLIYHQKAKHFKCHICGKKLYTGPGLTIHAMQVHRHTVKAIPNALPHRSDPDVEIYGTEGIPFLDIVARSKHKNVELVIKDKNLANAALPAKYERTLDAPYGTLVERAVKPSSPSAIASNIQPILKSYYTPSSADGGSCTPGDNSRILNGSTDLPNAPARIDADKINLTSDRSRLVHPIEDISLEEHRLRFSKYSIFLNNPASSINQLPNIPPLPYPVNYPYPYYPGTYAPYPYPPPQPGYVGPPNDYGVPLPPLPYPPIFQPSIYPNQPTYPPDNTQYPMRTNYYPQ